MKSVSTHPILQYTSNLLFPGKLGSRASWFSLAKPVSDNGDDEHDDDERHLPVLVL